MSRYDSFTAEAKVVLVLAEREAVRLGCGEVGTEHLLVGLVEEGEGVAARALLGLGVTVDRLHAVAPPSAAGATTGSPALTPGLDAALDAAVSEAGRAGSATVGTEHLLLGLTGIDDAGARVLASLGAGGDAVRAAVTAVSGAHAASPAVAPMHYPPPTGSAVVGAVAPVADVAAEVGARARAVAARRGEAVGPEHYLVALAEDRSGRAAEILRGHGLDAAALEAELGGGGSAR